MFHHFPQPPGSSPEINFHYEDVSIPFFNEEEARKWIESVISEESSLPGAITYVFCTDSYLYKINKRYLKHETLTDIITFDYSEEFDSLSGDIFISYERVLDNAGLNNQLPEQELHRVMIHGILHLLGYDDHTDQEKALMREKENYYLSLRSRSV